MKLALRPWENVFTVVSLLLFSQGFYTVVLRGAIGGDEGDIDSAILRNSLLLIYVITFSLLGFRLRRTLAFLNTNKWLLVIVGLALFSVSWSSVPGDSFRGAVAFTGSSGFALYLASRYTFKEQLKLMGWAFGIGLFGSFLFAFFVPAYGIMPSGSWRGIYPHKNGLGQNMVVSFLTFYFLSLSDKQHQLFFRVCCLLSILLILLGQSVTSLISIIFIFSTAQGLKLVSFKSKKRVFGILLFKKSRM
ncbi:MAG: O-antigen ligase family protein, partial [Cyanobacteria bacterium J06623_1]